MTSATPSAERRVLITGASSGIGLGIAQAFSAAGARVTATGATESEVQAAAARDPGIEFAVLDVRDGAAVEEIGRAHV